MTITKTLILNAILLCLPPMIVLGVFKSFSKIEAIRL